MIKKSAIVIYLFDVHALSSGDLKLEVELIKDHIGTSQLVVVANKIDVENIDELQKEFSEFQKYENTISHKKSKNYKNQENARRKKKDCLKQLH